jgi:hypothetical protein
MFNNEVEYASSRMTDSWFMTKKNEFCKVRIFLPSVGGALHTTRIRCIFPSAPIEKREQELYIKDFSFFPGRLGYINPQTGEDALFLVRMPLRKLWKQGLHPSQFLIINNFTERRVGDQTFFTHSKSIQNSLTDIYPSFEETLDLVEENGVGVAFSKQFSISDSFHLNYRGTRIGRLIFKNNGIIVEIQKEFTFVREELNQVVKNVEL